MVMSIILKVPHLLIRKRGIDGGFFVFGDVSCKVVGVHRLKFCLFDFHKYVVSIMLPGLAHSDHSNQGDSGSSLLSRN
jgi:hypothetical protein